MDKLTDHQIIRGSNQLADLIGSVVFIILAFLSNRILF
jgi:hypothetical protein